MKNGLIRWNEAISTLALLVAALALALFLKAYVIQPYIVDGQSMETTLSNHDRLLVDKLPRTFARLRSHPYVPQRGNIIIFNQQNLPGYSGSKQLVKRVIALPGERITVKSGKVTVYNAAHPKGFNPDTTGKYKLNVSQINGDVNVKLEPNQIFVMGDNRNFSEDSRYFGPVELNQIVGVLSFRIWPLGQIQHFH